MKARSVIERLALDLVGRAFNHEYDGRNHHRHDPQGKIRRERGHDFDDCREWRAWASRKLDQIHEHAQIFTGDRDGRLAGFIRGPKLLVRDDAIHQNTCGSPLNVTAIITRVTIGSR